MKGSSDIPVFKDWRDLVNPEDSGWSQKSFAAKLKQIASILTGVPIESWEDPEFKNSCMPEYWRTMLDDKGNLVNAAGLERYKFNTPTYRQFLQQLGTNAIRDKIHPNTWVNALFADYKPFPNGNKEIKGVPLVGGGKFITEGYTMEWPNWLITDLRFPNEAEAIRSKGGINIKLLRNTIGWHQTCMTCFQGFTLDEIKKDRYAPCGHGLNYASILAEPQHISETALDDYKFDYTIDNRFCTLEGLVEKVRAMLIHFKLIKDNES